MQIKSYDAKVFELSDDKGNPTGRVVIHHDPELPFVEIYRADIEVHDPGNVENGPELVEDLVFVWIGRHIGPVILSQDSEEVLDLFKQAMAWETPVVEKEALTSFLWNPLGIVTILTHSDEVSGTTVLNDCNVYWTEGRSSSVVVVQPNGTWEAVGPHQKDHPIWQRLEDVDNLGEGKVVYRQMTSDEEADWTRIRGLI